MEYEIIYINRGHVPSGTEPWQSKTKSIILKYIHHRDTLKFVQCSYTCFCWDRFL